MGTRLNDETYLEVLSVAEIVRIQCTSTTPERAPVQYAEHDLATIIKKTAGP